MEAGEVEFVAEKEMVTITPNFSENKITLISVRLQNNLIICCIKILRISMPTWGRFPWKIIKVFVEGFLEDIHFVQGEFGPFNPSMHSSVPLWLAVHLKQRQKCRIEPPDWMNVGR